MDVARGLQPSGLFAVKLSQFLVVQDFVPDHSGGYVVDKLSMPRGEYLFYRK